MSDTVVVTEKPPAAPPSRLKRTLALAAAVLAAGSVLAYVYGSVLDSISDQMPR